MRERVMKAIWVRRTVTPLAVRSPTLCIEHADEASREQGWTPENSHD